MLKSEKELTEIEKSQIEENKNSLFKLCSLIIFLCPIVFISEDNILKIALFSYICFYIKKITKNHGKKYGKMSLRLGLGKFLKLHLIFLCFSIGTTMTLVEDMTSEILIYTVRRNYEPKKSQIFNYTVLTYKVSAMIPDLVNRASLTISSLIETNEGGFPELLKNKIMDHIVYETMKRELCFKLIEMRDKGLFISKEEQGPIEYFVVGMIKRSYSSIIDSLSFILTNYIWSFVYYIMAFFSAKHILRKNIVHHSKCNNNG